MEATGSNSEPPSTALAAKIAAANKAAAEAEAAAQRASAAIGACSWTIPATVHPEAYDSTTYDQSPACSQLSYSFAHFEQKEEEQEVLLVRELASARARRPPKVFMGGETDTMSSWSSRSCEPTPATPLDGWLRLKSKIESDDRNSYHPDGQESTTALGHSFNTTACAEEIKKEKSISL